MTVEELREQIDRVISGQALREKRKEPESFAPGIVPDTFSTQGIS
jgi:hypothetical protein